VVAFVDALVALFVDAECTDRIGRRVRTTESL